MPTAHYFNLDTINTHTQADRHIHTITIIHHLTTCPKQLNSILPNRRKKECFLERNYVFRRVHNRTKHIQYVMFNLRM